MTIAQHAAGGGPWSLFRATGNASLVLPLGSIVGFTINADGTTTGTGATFSQRWWASGATPIPCFVCYSSYTGSPLSASTTVTESPTRVSTATGPGIFIENSSGTGTLEFYSEETGGFLLYSMTFYIELTTPI